MLETLRRGAKSWIAKALIILLIVSFAVWGIGDIFSFRLNDAVAAVGEEEVSAESFADAMQRQQSQFSQQAGRLVSYSDLRALGMDQRVLAGLMRDAAMRAELNALEISAPDRAVAEAIRENAAFQGPAGNFSDQAYRLLLAQQGVNPTEFEAITRAVLAEEIVTGAVAGVQEPPPGMATRIAAYRGEMRSVDILLLPTRMAEAPEAPGDAELEAFFGENEVRFTVPERRFGSYLLVDTAALAETLQPSEEELRAAYENEKDRYVTEPTRTLDQISFPDMASAEAAAARLASGEITFDALAEELGQSGDLSLGQVRADELPGAVAEAVFAMDEPGVSGAVETTLGAVILRVTELTVGGATPFEEVKDRIAAVLAEDAALRRAPEVANEIEELRAAGKPFAEIASETGAAYGRIEGLAADGSLADGSQAGGVLTDPTAAAEILDALDAEERDMIELDDGSYFVAMIERVEPSHVPALAEIRDAVEAAWSEEQVLSALDARAEKLAAGLSSGSGATLTSAAAGMGRTVREIGLFTRSQPPGGVPAGLVDDIFAADQGEVLTARDPAGEGVLLVQVSEIAPMEPAPLEAMSGQLDIALTESMERDIQGYFFAAVQNHHGASTNPQVVEEVFRLLSGGGGGL